MAGRRSPVRRSNGWRPRTGGERRRQHPGTVIRRPMVARPIDEPHRTSSQLELLFDLTFVVAIAGVTAQLAHDVAAGHAGAAIVPFLQVIFAIWWAWMNFTWFA